MPAKRKKLPHPCPKCGSSFGTVQIVFFHLRRKVEPSRSRYDAWNKHPKPTHRWNGSYDNGVFRIGHYDSTSYAKTKKENKKLDNLQTDEVKNKKLRTSQKRWCSFRSQILLFDDEFSDYHHLEKTITLPFYDYIQSKVLQRGWEMI